MPILPIHFLVPRTNLKSTLLLLLFIRAILKIKSFRIATCPRLKPRRNNQSQARNPYATPTCVQPRLLYCSLAFNFLDQSDLFPAVLTTQRSKCRPDIPFPVCGFRSLRFPALRNFLLPASFPLPTNFRYPRHVFSENLRLNKISAALQV